MAQCPAVPQWADPGTTARGNPTTARVWLDTTNTWVASHAQYDRLGNVRKSWDANGNLSRVDYADSFSDEVTTRNTFAFPTAVTSPVPDPSGAHASATALVTTTVYDFSTGLITSTTDANDQTTTFEYNDALDRLRRVNLPGGGWTSHDYGRNACGDWVISKSALDSSRFTQVHRYFDGLGRPSRSYTPDPQDSSKPWLTSDTEYDPMGRVKRVSQPYRSTGCDSIPFSGGKWMESEYDALGRVKTVTTKPDNAAVKTDYSGDRVLVTDQAGKQRISRTDALGRLAGVWEVRPPDTPSGTEAVSFPSRPDVPAVAAGYRTSYAYDVLGNLRKVDQGGLLRFFMYDSLGRLVRAKNPEQGAFTPDDANGDFPTLTDSTSGTANDQWSVGYTYYANGNLFKRRDARNVTTTYSYDALNRNTLVDYSDTTVYQDVRRHYDNGAAGMNGKGRFWHDYHYWQGTTKFEHAAVDSYDAAGRARNRRQHFYENTSWQWGPAYNVRYEYDLAGNVTQITYPSERTVSYTYDAAGRLADAGGESAMKGTLGDGVPRTYASEVRYHELGGMEQERFGTQTPVYNKSLYNSRGQLSEIRVSTYSITSPGNETNWNRGAIINHYSNALGAWGATGGGSDNNGNLMRAEVFVPNGDDYVSSGYWQRAQYYTYDALNRLDQVHEKDGGNVLWQQDYAYDRWGNRTVDAEGTWLGNSSAPPSDRIPEKQFTVIMSGGAPATNRLEVPAGQPGAMGYDAAGNLTYDSYSNFSGGGSRTFDAEGRMTSAQYFDGQTRTAAYAYDADGRRVRRANGLGDETWQVYGLGGELLAEYAAQAQTSSPRKEYGYRGGQLLVTADTAAGGAQQQRTNVASSAQGATATASFTHSASYPAGAAINGDRKGLNWGAGGGWNDATADAYPDWLEVSFSGAKSIDEVSVFTLQDNLSNPSEPTAGQTFTLYGITAFHVQYWTGGAWATVPGGSVSGNNKVWRKFTFPAVTTDRVRVLVNGALFHNSRIVEVEAYESAAATQSFVTGQTLGALRNDYTGQVGMRVTTGAAPLTLTSLGRICAAGNSGNHTLKVVRASDNAVVAQAAVSMAGCAAGQWRYAGLGVAVTLAAGAAYYVVSAEVAGGDQWHDYAGTALETTAAASVNSGAFSGNGTSWIAAGGAGNY